MTRKAAFPFLSSLSDLPMQQYGISPQRFQENEHLSSFFEILTTSTDEDNQVYVSTVQACGYPVTAFQWHPEVLLYVLCIRAIVICLQMHVLVGQIRTQEKYGVRYSGNLGRMMSHIPLKKVVLE